MKLLKQREASGESLTDKEIEYLELLENRRIAVLENLIKDIKAKGTSLEDKELLQINLHEQEKISHLLDQLYRKKNKTQADFDHINELERQAKLLKLEELRLKKKMGIITQEEEELLRQLELEFQVVDESLFQE